MNGKDRSSRAKKLGEYVGRCWKRYSRALDKISHRLQQVGVPRALSRIVGRGLHAVVIFGLLYAAFWVTLMAITLFVICSFRIADDKATGWRHGPEGYGYYESGERIDYGRLFDEDE